MFVDLRSDTVTRPTSGMLEAMFAARVGDDVFGDDPTVNALEEKAAALFGMEAALFCPSGTMTNQIAIKVHTRAADEVICDRLAHIYNYEGGGIAANAGCSVRLLGGNAGLFTAEMVEQNINAEDPHFPRTTLVCAENTCNKGGGSIWDIRDLKAISVLCKNRGLKFHLDGARLFNAMVETGDKPHDFGKLFDSISICLSKGLGCPVGSLLIGSKAFVHNARRVRKYFGGGMRQAGFLAAAGIYALDHHVARLKEDHGRARQIAKMLEQEPWVKGILPVSTNVVVAELAQGIDQQQALHGLQELGIPGVAFGKGMVRFVTHLDVTDDHLAYFEKQLKKAFR